MDRNGDGDLSPNEFLGRRDLFDKIDRDGDDLISPDEANAAHRDAVAATPPDRNRRNHRSNLIAAECLVRKPFGAHAMVRKRQSNESACSGPPKGG